MQTRSSFPKLTKNCSATTILRQLINDGKVTKDMEPELVYDLHREFEKYSLERFPQFLEKRWADFDGKFIIFIRISLHRR